jgi:general secretion pathway protein B
MSYILDALKKAEHERDLGRVPRLESMQDSAPPRRRSAVWLIAGALLINAGVLAWWLRPTAPPAAVSSERRPVPVPRAVPPAVVPAPAAVTAPSASVAAPATVPKTVPESTPTPVAAAVAPRTVQAPPVVSAPPRAGAESMAATPPANVPSVPAVAPAPPLLRDLPAEFRAAVPALSLDVHVYAPTASGRFVLINMKKYREGEQLAEGPRIEEITADGVVLNYQGERFRIARP